MNNLLILVLTHKNMNNICIVYIYMPYNMYAVTNPF